MARHFAAVGADVVVGWQGERGYELGYEAVVRVRIRLLLHTREESVESSGPEFRTFRPIVCAYKLSCGNYTHTNELRELWRNYMRLQHPPYYPIELYVLTIRP